jgi:hypothetical protein
MEKQRFTLAWGFGEGQASRSSPGVASLLLQLRQASHGVEVRTRDEDAGDPGWTDDATADIRGDLPAGDVFWVIRES